MSLVFHLVQAAIPTGAAVLCALRLKRDVKRHWRQLKTRLNLPSSGDWTIRQRLTFAAIMVSMSTLYAAPMLDYGRATIAIIFLNPLT
jgi:hypothetical protein